MALIIIFKILKDQLNGQIKSKQERRKRTIKIKYNNKCVVAKQSRYRKQR